MHVVEGFVSPGNYADVSVDDNLTTEVSGCYPIEDKGYDSNAHRAHLLSHNNIALIPGGKNKKEPII